MVGLRRRVVDADRLLDDVQLLLRQVQALGHFLLRGRTAQFFLELARRPPPLGQQLDHVGRDADRLGGVHQGPFDRLLDPERSIRAEAGVHRRVKALDGPQEAEVPLGDQVLEVEALADVAAGDVDDQAEVGADHAVAGLDVAQADLLGERFFLVSRQERRLVDLAQVGFQRRLDWVAALFTQACHADTSSAILFRRSRSVPAGIADRKAPDRGAPATTA